MLGRAEIGASVSSPAGVYIGNKWEPTSSPANVRYWMQLGAVISIASSSRYHQPDLLHLKDECNQRSSFSSPSTDDREQARIPAPAFPSARAQISLHPLEVQRSDRASPSSTDNGTQAEIRRWISNFQGQDPNQQHEFPGFRCLCSEILNWQPRSGHPPLQLKTPHLRSRQSLRDRTQIESIHFCNRRGRRADRLIFNHSNYPQQSAMKGKPSSSPAYWRNPRKSSPSSPSMDSPAPSTSISNQPRWSHLPLM